MPQATLRCKSKCSPYNDLSRYTWHIANSTYNIYHSRHLFVDFAVRPPSLILPRSILRHNRNGRQPEKKSYRDVSRGIFIKKTFSQEETEEKRLTVLLHGRLSKCVRCKRFGLSETVWCGTAC